ncbi:MAG TPA: hypothetical protein VN648_28205, partial [Candidatus Methylomirabilis sp.]|nr:hypothetical protein [Candidatus Methylomirabilis sp.]
MRKLITLPLGLLLLTSAAAQEPAIEPGKERWPIKSSVPQNTIAPRAAGTSQPKVVALSDLLVLGDPQPPVAKDDRRFQAALIPKFPNSLDVAEGDILTTTAWLHLVALETDGDYHIQVSASPDSG